ncbi:LysR family transcriptional regulator [Yangia mangrovi]|uniref:LysR family transcriptional regulator n=1 Tax=Alloyangia mangrovi TaxID=1779329 RepID=A0A2A3JXB5_9RHOB|nr:LysR family transcriptional regulator [Alloyangia mangrovi]MCA0939867.1 LysR family transcriptional regulator [Alloyangia pacifica]MCA0945005.1 LysR family transcriptional regulator [Alloyangia pacifica]MCT4370061.1 LysR family transcriptional regulator [Alloyangia mangrovi]
MVETGSTLRDWQPELRTLRYFLCVAEEKNMTRASERLRIAQPALSRQIARLESDLGLRVFNRTARGMELTEAGEILQRRAYAIMAQIAQAHHDVTAHAEKPQGVVVVGMPPTPGEFITPPLLSRVKAEYPEIELRFVEGFSNALEHKLSQGEIGLAVMHDAPLQDDIVTTELLVEHLNVIGPCGSFDKDSYTLAEAAAMPLIMPSRPNFLRILVDKHADEIGAGLNIVQRVDGVWHLKSLVRHGHGFTILTYGGVLSEVQNGTLEARPIVSPQISWTLCTATKADQRRKKAIQVVEALVRDIVGELVAAGIWR